VEVEAEATAPVQVELEPVVVLHIVIQELLVVVVTNLLPVEVVVHLEVAAAAEALKQT
jgi:hypothetical protein